MEIGAKQLGAGCPTGPAMPPGRRFGLGGVGASPYAPHIQLVLPVHREWHGSRRPLSGSVLEGVPDVGKLSSGTRRVCNLDDQRDTEPADRPLPSNEAGPHHRFAGRRHAGGGEQRVGGASPRPASAAWRVERASADGFNQTLTGVTGSGNITRLAATGICGDSTEPGSAGGYGKVTDQSGTYRIGTNFATNGSTAIMSGKTLTMADERQAGDCGKLAGGWL